MAEANEADRAGRGSSARHTRRKHAINLCCAQSVQVVVDQVARHLKDLGFTITVTYGAEARAALLGSQTRSEQPTIHVVCVQGSLQERVLKPLRQALATHGGPNDHLFVAVLDLGVPLAIVGQIRRFAEALERTAHPPLPSPGLIAERHAKQQQKPTDHHFAPTQVIERASTTPINTHPPESSTHPPRTLTSHGRAAKISGTPKYRAVTVSHRAIAGADSGIHKRKRARSRAHTQADSFPESSTGRVLSVPAPDATRPPPLPSPGSMSRTRTSPPTPSSSLPPPPPLPTRSGPPTPFGPRKLSPAPSGEDELDRPILRAESEFRFTPPGVKAAEPGPPPPHQRAEPSSATPSSPAKLSHGRTALYSADDRSRPAQPISETSRTLPLPTTAPHTPSPEFIEPNEDSHSRGFIVLDPEDREDDHSSTDSGILPPQTRLNSEAAAPSARPASSTITAAPSATEVEARPQPKRGVPWWIGAAFALLIAGGLWVAYRTTADPPSPTVPAPSVVRAPSVAPANPMAPDRGQPPGATGSGSPSGSESGEVAAAPPDPPQEPDPDFDLDPVHPDSAPAPRAAPPPTKSVHPDPPAEQTHPPLPPDEQILAAAAAKRRIIMLKSLFASRRQGQATDWAGASARCASFGIDDIDDWRLPHRREMKLLNAVLPLKSGLYWTKTIPSDTPTAAYGLDTRTGELISTPKDSAQGEVICVRRRKR